MVKQPPKDDRGAEALTSKVSNARRRERLTDLRKENERDVNPVVKHGRLVDLLQVDEHGKTAFEELLQQDREPSEE